MTVLKCTICGGEIEVSQDLSVGICKFCGSSIVIPKELDRKGNLYNRAVFLRQNNEFDKALATYEDILKEDNTDAEAHWGLVLSKYGIEYVADPRTNLHIPTCHRTQEQSILSDPDYLAALEYSEPEAREIIEKEAKRISEIQKKILEISRKEPPYDIFICYKETDEQGNRIEDSTLAQEIYYELLKKDYKVFFARKTLESKLGSEYEPIIYAALNSARVMIVLGTKPEYFTSVWVRNEWSRFLKMSKDAHKTIIPAYRGMSPYELPVELSSLQSLDMSKIGFLQDLLDGIERCMRGETKKKNEISAPESSFGTPVLNRLIQNGTTYLKLDNYTAAEEVYTRITKEYPEDYRGWWGLIVCETKDFLTIVPDQTTLNTWYKYVKQLAPKEDFTKMEEKYLSYTSSLANYSADEDIKAVNERIRAFNSQIKDLKSQIDETNSLIKQEKNSFEALAYDDNHTISQIGGQLAQNTKWSKFNLIRKIICICLLALAVVLFLGGRDTIPIAVIPFVAGMILITTLRKSKVYKAIINENQNSLRLAKSNKTVHQKEHDSKLQELDEQLLAQNRRISNLTERISECEDYIALGRKTISAYWFAQRCAAFGVNQEADLQTTTLREKVFE